MVLLTLVFGVPFVIAVAALVGFVGYVRKRSYLDYQRLAVELRDSQLRIAELEAKLARVDETADFTRRVLQKELERR